MVVNRYMERQDVNAVGEEMADSKIVRSEVVMEIYSIIDFLPPTMRRISKTGYLKGLKSSEITEELEFLFETVKVQKKRVPKQLRLRLNPESLLTLHC